MHSRPSLLEELTRFSSTGLETRGENAFNVAVKFMELLEHENPETYDLMMKAWFRAVKDNDFGKFKRTYRKYKDGKDPIPKM